jgi:lysozyme
MMICKAAIDLVKSFEGVHDGDLAVIGLQPKMCPAGIWTVGYGRALRSKSTNAFLKGASGKAEALAKYPALTLAQAEEMLAFDLTAFEDKVKALVKVDVNDNQLGALVSFAYNVGAGNLASSTLLKKLNAKDYAGASVEFLKWDKAGGKILKGLTLRRTAEMSLFLQPC